MVLERFSGRVAILSGATQGIGLATAKRLGQEGCKVVVSSRRQKNVDNAVDYLQKEGVEASGIASNQINKEDRARLIKHTCDKYGGFDCLFISAGSSPYYGSLLQLDEDNFDKAFGTNVKSNFNFIQECIPHFIERGGGSIVTNATAAVYGFINLMGAKDLALYTWSKLCLVAMTQHVSRDCFDFNIRVNCVAPGAIETRFYDGAVDQGLTEIPTMLETVGAMKGKPSSRRGKPEEVASTVAFLLSDDASYLTGNCVIPCGGFPFNRVL